MDSSLQDIIDDARAAVAASADPAALANAKARFLGKDGAVTQRDQVAKPVHQHGQHGHDHLHPEGDHADEADRHADMFAPIRDCAAVLTRGMGYGAHTGLTGIGVQPIITDVRLIADGVAAYVAGTIVDHPERLH